MLNVLDPGLSTTVQDIGRLGWYHMGMPPSGAMDNFSFRIANALVGNAETSAGLEITYSGPRLEIVKDAVISVTGAEIRFEINGKGASLWQAHKVQAGDTVTLGSITRGARSYMSISGGIDVPEKLGSRSTYTLGRFGGFNGRKLKANDKFPTGQQPATSNRMIARHIDKRLIPKLAKDITLRVVIGMCSHRITENSLQEFLSASWEVTPEADRIGYRLKGPTLQFVEGEQPFGAGADPSNVVDLGYPVGSIQVPGGLEAIVLLNDAVTGGGYTTIGTVIRADLDLIAQASPGSIVRFAETNIENALRARKEREDALQQIRMELRMADQVGLLGQ